MDAAYGRPESLRDDDAPEFLERAGELSPLEVALRYKWAVLAFAVVVAGLTYAGLKLVSPTYVSAASVVIEGGHMNLVGDANLFTRQPLEPDEMKTEMEVLSSPSLARRVVDELGLASRRAFELCRADGLVAGLKATLFGYTDQQCRPDPDIAVRKLLGDVVTFSNDHVSYVAKISATTTDPKLAAAIANAYANAFVAWRKESRARQADEAGTWLASYLAGLHDRMEKANQAVENYRQDHHLINLSPGPSGGQSQTIVAQSLSQLNSQLIQTDSELAEKRADLAQARAGGGSAATTLSSPVVQDLLERRADASATLAQKRARYGDDHPQVLAAEAELARIQDQLGAESGRAVTSLAGSVRALEARHAALTAEVHQLQQGVAGQSAADVSLQELTREADTENALYRTMLQRLKEIDAERHIALADSQVAVAAMVPLSPTFPRKAMMVAGAFLASLGIGIGLAFMREMMNPRFRDLAQLQSETGMPVLGAFVRPQSGASPMDVTVQPKGGIEAELLHTVLARLVSGVSKEGGKIAMITSAVPSEGKTSFAVSLGRAASNAGFRTLVFDGDLRRSGLSGLIGSAPSVAPSVAPSLAAPRDSALPARRADALVEDERSGLRLQSMAGLVSDPRRLLATPELPDAFAELRKRYDLILLDTPPVLAAPDTASFAPLVDETIVLIDWTRTHRDALQAALRALRRAGARIAGIVVAKLTAAEYARVGEGAVHDLGRYSAYFAKRAA